MTTTTTAPAPQPGLVSLAAAAKADRNRAVDAYRAGAMLAVAIGHWAAVAVAVRGGELWAGNALEHAPSMSWLTWAFQVMPLFFVVGGFASAMSLDAHAASGGSAHDWVVQRMRRMLAPAVLLAGTWTVLLFGGYVVGFGGLMVTGALAAAIPLWFLANYTIDTAVAPWVLGAFRRRRALVIGGGLAVFSLVELARAAQVPVVPQVNWVLGWMLFQIAGFAWRDGLLPAGRRMLAIAGGLWATAIAAVAFGPWPVTMVHFPGVQHSPTHPPTPALMLFGAAYSATAVAVAPRVTAFLAGGSRVSVRAWSVTAAGNAVAMSVYLWHMTAAVAAVAVLHGIDALPSADVGTVAWWFQKLPLMGLAAVVLVGIVSVVSGHERRALLATPQAWGGSTVGVLVLAGGVSTSVKLWASGSAATACVGLAGLLMAWRVLRAPDSGREEAIR